MKKFKNGDTVIDDESGEFYFIGYLDKIRFDGDGLECNCVVISDVLLSDGKFYYKNTSFLWPAKGRYLLIESIFDLELFYKKQKIKKQNIPLLNVDWVMENIFNIRGNATGAR